LITPQGKRSDWSFPHIEEEGKREPSC
jgi:hypothetical protein